MFDAYQAQFTKSAINAGYSQDNIIACLDYAKPLIDRGLPVIYNTSHLAALVGYRKEYIKKAAFNTPYYYRNFAVKKKNGKERLISEPLPSLKEIQCWILKEILAKVKVSIFAKAYRPGIGIVQNLKFHVGQPIVYTLDISDFFPSIKQEGVERIFNDLGYSHIVSNLLSKLCTLNNCLPQGAPTSPYISNLFFRDVDQAIGEYCKHHGIKYTRYADDLTFSGLFDPKPLHQIVEPLIEGLGLKINPTKSRVMTRNMRQIVTGVPVNDKMQVVFYKRNEIRKAMYYINKFGLDEHMRHERIEKANYVEYLLGKINFVLHLNPSDKEFQKYREVLRNILKQDPSK